MKTADILDRRASILDRIMERVVVMDLGFMFEGQPSPCHIWQGPTSGEGKGGGYGRMSLNAQTVAVHIVVYTHYYGYIPGKKQIDHLCSNRLCCNPGHLELVSHLKNQRRRASRAKEKQHDPACEQACQEGEVRFSSLVQAGKGSDGALRSADRSLQQLWQPEA